MPIEFKKAELDNGLTVIAERDGDAHSAAVGFFVRTGARDEAHEVMGVSHFLEHMMFKGTERLSADELNRGFDEIGARNNAYTSGEMTAFHAHVLPEFLPRATELIGTMMRPALREEDFTTEKGVILEEIAMYKDQPFWVLYEQCLERHYRGHPLGHRVLGTAESIAALTAGQMREYFARRYSADNTVAAFAGNIDFDAVVGQLEALCGHWEKTGAERDSTPPPVGAGRFEVRDPNVSRAYQIGIASAPPAGDESRYAAALAAQVLGAPDNSRLHWALIETGLADEAMAEYQGHDGVGEFFVYSSGEPGRAGQVWEVVEKEVAGLSESLTEDDLASLRGRMATAVTVGGERPADRMHRIGRLWTVLGEYRTLEEELERINRVTVEQVREVLERFPMGAGEGAGTHGVLLPG